MGAVKRSFDVQVTFYPLTFLRIAVGHGSSSSEVMVALAQIVPIFGNVCIELQRRGPPSLIRRDSLVGPLS